jgi:hypothetical protein
MQQKAAIEKEQKSIELKALIEKNPKLRIQQQPMKTKMGTVVIQNQLSVEEALIQLPEWREYLSSHEGHYAHEFIKLVEGLKKGISVDI